MVDNKTAPLISVVIPCFNASGTLKNTLDSVLEQDYSDYEVIMVDDGSTDITPDIIADYEKRDHRFRSFRQVNRGVSAARNKGVSLAKGDFIAFLDADDLFYSKSLTERVKVLMQENDSALLGVFCPAEMIFSNGQSMGLPALFNYLLPNDRLYFSFTSESVFNPSCVIVKKEAFLKAGGFDEAIAPAEDYLLWHKMMRSGGYFRVVRYCKIGYTQHPISAVRSRLHKHYKQCKRVSEKIFSEDPDAIRECKKGFGQSLYYRSLSDRAFSTAIMAVVMGESEVLKEVLPDISKYVIEMTTPEILESRIKFNALRALCKHKNEWDGIVFPNIKEKILDFINVLNDRLGGDCSRLLELKESLSKTNQSRKTSITSFREIRAFIDQILDWLKQNRKNKIIITILLMGYTLFIIFIVIISILIFIQ